VKVRSVTAFVEVSYPLEADAIAHAGDALQAFREALDKAGFTIQTTRLATQPFREILGSAGADRAVDLAKDLAALAFVHEIDYIALGPSRIEDAPSYTLALADVLGGTENIFASVEIADRQAGLSLPHLRRVASLIRQAAGLQEDGFANLRLAALANVPPWSPFFPAAYHGGGKTRVAIATESADVALEAVSNAASLEQARNLFVRAVEAEAKRLENAVQKVAERNGILFQGIDFSLAPYPVEVRSIGAALEKFGLPSVGKAGTLATAAFLTDALDRAHFARTGFCGLMLPVLEDSVLAQRAAQGVLRVGDLLAYSAVCGTGLDTIPLPGDVSEGALAAILLDVAALALRLDKPLTARLMPLPGKQAGDEVAFEFEYFAHSRVMAPNAEPLEGLLAGDEQFLIQPRSSPA